MGFIRKIKHLFSGVEKTTNNSKQQAPATKTISDGERNFCLFEDVLDGCILRYEYEDKICLDENAISLVVGNGGKHLTFEPEPTNPYDAKAIKISFRGNKIGYVYRGKIQDMINDWISRGDTFVGYINKYSLTNNTATYKIGFYKSLDKYESKQFSLVKTSKRIDEYTTRIDNLECCEPGELVELDYDSFDETCIVHDSSGGEIGELPKSAIKFIESSDYDNIIGLIKNIDYASDKPKCYVSIHLVK